MVLNKAVFCLEVGGCKTVSHITYTVLEETLNPAQSINQSLEIVMYKRW